MCLKIQQNAIFVADAHYNAQREEFLVFLKALQNGTIQTEQLFLMGDMFDFIAGGCYYFIEMNEEIINIINELSNSMQIIYLEGNHDYNLKIIFPNVQVLSRDEQPLMATYENKTVALSHGDIYVNDKLYDIYCKIIRNKPLLTFLNWFDFNGFLSRKIYNSLIGSDICRVIPHFESIVEKRLKHYNTDIVIEGHFHQGKAYEKENKYYKNIPSLACSKEYVRLSDGKFIGESIE